MDQNLDTATASHTYVDNGAYVLTASITDDVALTGADARTITIANAAPVATAETGLLAGDGFPFTLLLTTFTDNGANDTHTASIDWGDGTTTAGTVDEDLGTVSGTHAYLDLGNHTVTVTISDSDGDSVGSGSPEESLSIGALTAATWTQPRINVSDASALAAVACVGIAAASDPGAVTLQIDRFEGAPEVQSLQVAMNNTIPTKGITFIQTVDADSDGLLSDEVSPSH